MRTAEIARLFGCTVEQARQQIERTVADLRACLAKCATAKGGKVRGLTAAWYSDRITAFEKVL